VGFLQMAFNPKGLETTQKTKEDPRAIPRISTA
jgi:hypothetical protein